MSLGIFQSHKITGQIGLEGIFKGHLIQAGHHVPGTPSFHCPRLFQALPTWPRTFSGPEPGKMWQVVEGGTAGAVEEERVWSAGGERRKQQRHLEWVF